jgi:hypothetical protein
VPLVNDTLTAGQHFVDRSGLGSGVIHVAKKSKKSKKGKKKSKKK